MRQPRHTIGTLAGLLVLGLLVPGVPVTGSGARPAHADPVDDAERYRTIHLLFEAMDRVQSHYVEDLSTETLVELAIEGIMSGLDEHSRFLGPEDFDSMKASTRGRFFGVGVVISIRGGVPTVISALADTPARRAGLRAGDRIVRIDEATTDGMSLDDVTARLRGEQGTRVRLEVRRRGVDDPLLVELERARIEVESVTGPVILSPGVAYIAISRFSETTGESFAAALDALDRQAVRGLVLDLRGNPGGLLSQGVAVAERFVPMGDVIVEVRGRSRGDCRVYRSGVTPKWTLPVAVLVDGGTASAAEIVAAAIQDHHLGAVVGERTFGKGSVQSIFAFDVGHALKLTTAHYFTPSGRSVEAGAPSAGSGPSGQESVSLARPAPGPGGRPASASPVGSASPAGPPGGAPGTTGHPGGVVPDVVAAPAPRDSLTGALIEEGVTLDFLGTAEPDPALDLSRPLPDDYILRFRAFAAERSDVPIAGIDDAALDGALREEIAFQRAGEEAALRVRLESDTQFWTAVAALPAPEDAVVATEVSVPAR